MTVQHSPNLVVRPYLVSLICANSFGFIVSIIVAMGFWHLSNPPITQPPPALSTQILLLVIPTIGGTVSGSMLILSIVESSSPLTLHGVNVITHMLERVVRVGPTPHFSQKCYHRWTESGHIGELAINTHIIRRFHRTLTLTALVVAAAGISGFALVDAFVDPIPKPLYPVALVLSIAIPLAAFIICMVALYLFDDFVRSQKVCTWQKESGACDLRLANRAVRIYKSSCVAIELRLSHQEAVHSSDDDIEESPFGAQWLLECSLISLAEYTIPTPSNRDVSVPLLGDSRELSSLSLCGDYVRHSLFVVTRDFATAAQVATSLSLAFSLPLLNNATLADYDRERGA